MDTNTTLVGFTLAVTMLTLVVALLAYWEFGKLRDLRKELQQFQADLHQRLFQAQKAQQRIVASYGVADPNQKIALLKSAVDADPNSFNGYNALGYAYLAQGDLHAAIAAFKEATVRHPGAKEGYFDLAEAYRNLKRIDLCKEVLEKAIKADPSAKADLENDSRFREVLGKPVGD
ncbi:MAG TPA: tetratricopeptide repeat protein [Candidatus Competibacteraceae bacterium]|nr:tetratricopeptide repeat protein [Candidatus Competibacteraceae bacterium]